MVLSLHAAMVVLTSNDKLLIQSFCLSTAHISRCFFQNNLLDSYRTRLCEISKREKRSSLLFDCLVIIFPETKYQNI